MTSEEKKLDKKDDPAYVFNPASNRWVKKDGIVGKRMARDMTRAETLEHLRHHAVNTSIEHRKLLASNLSNEELLKILKKVIDIKLDVALDDIPPKPPKLVRQVGIHKKAKRKKRASNVPKSKPRFKLKAPPQINTETEVETEADTDYGHSNHWQSDSEISD